MWVEPAVADAYWSQVQGSVYHDGDPGYWGFPCDEELPDFELEIGDGKAVIPGRLMSAGYLNDTGALPRKCLLLSFIPALFFHPIFSYNYIHNPSSRNFRSFTPNRTSAYAWFHESVIAATQHRSRAIMLINNENSLHWRSAGPIWPWQRWCSIFRSPFCCLQSG